MSTNLCTSSPKLVDYTKFRRDDMPSRTGKPFPRVISKQRQEAAASATVVTTATKKIPSRPEDGSISPQSNEKVISNSTESNTAPIDFLFKRVSLDHRTRRRNSELSREELVMEFEKRSLSHRASSSSHHDELQSSKWTGVDTIHGSERRTLEGKFITIPKQGRRLTHIERILRKPASSYSMDHVRRKSWKSSEGVYHRSGSEPALHFSGSKAA